MANVIYFSSVLLKSAKILKYLIALMAYGILAVKAVICYKK